MFSSRLLTVRKEALGEAAKQRGFSPSVSTGVFLFPRMMRRRHPTVAGTVLTFPTVQWMAHISLWKSSLLQFSLGS